MKLLALLPLLLPLLLVVAYLVPGVESAQKKRKKTKWIPNEEDESIAGPLPSSQQRREQLQRLDQVINKSPDPAATLARAAAANNMDPQELKKLLKRNRQDLAMARRAGDLPPPSRRRTTRSRRFIFGEPPIHQVWHALTGLAGVLWHAAVKHPRTAGFTGTVVVLLLYAAILV